MLCSGEFIGCGFGHYCSVKMQERFFARLGKQGIPEVVALDIFVKTDGVAIIDFAYELSYLLLLKFPISFLTANC